MTRNGLIPKRVTAHRSDGSTYETTVHTRPNDAAAVQFDNVSLMPISITTSSHHPLDEFPELRPVRVDNAKDTWSIRRLEYPFYNADITLDEAIKADLDEHGVTVIVDDPGHSGLGGAPKVSVTGSFDNMKRYLSSYLDDPSINDITIEQLEADKNLGTEDKR